MKRQRGYAAVILLVLSIMGALTLLVSQLGAVDTNSVLAGNARSRDSLQEAKAALVAWAVRHPHNPGNRAATPCQPEDAAGPPCPDRPGALPCPDLNNDGWADEPCDAANQRVGRLPWRTLNIADLRDSTGERLWYAVAANVRHQTVYPGPFWINAFSVGDIRVCAVGSACTAGNPQQEIGAQLVALVIAPGAPFAGQDRTGGNVNVPANYLEARNSNVADADFDSGPASPNFNDALLPLSAAELFDAVTPVVASRINQSVAPAIRAAYNPNGPAAQRWVGLPYPVAFSDPLTSTFDGTAVAPPMEGLMPAHTNLASVSWIVGSEVMSGGGPGSTITCAIASGAYNCSITLVGATFPANVGIAATLSNVGRAFVLPFTVASMTTGANIFSINAVQHGPISTADFSAGVFIQLTLSGSPAGFTFGAPQIDPALTSATLGFGAPTAWFTQNRWHQNVYYAVSPRNWAAGGGAPCTVGVDCLTIARDLTDGTLANTTNSNNLDGVMMVMGRPLAPIAPANVNDPAQYLEVPNRPPRAVQLQFASRPPKPVFNDFVVAVHP